MKVTVSKKRIAIHEASHAVVSRLFEDNLQLEYVTIDPKKFGKAAEEGVTIYGTNGIKLRKFSEVCVAVVTLAGIVGEKIWQDGPKKVHKNKAAILDNPSVMNLKLGGGDFKMFTDNAVTFDHKYGGPKKYQDICFDFLLDLLCDEKIWPVVEQLSSALLKKDDLTLGEKELDTIFEKFGYAEFVKSNKERLMKQLEPKLGEDSTESQIENLITPNDCDIF